MFPYTEHFADFRTYTNAVRLSGSSLIVAGFVFCKGEAMRRKNREKNQVGLRKRKARRLGKKNPKMIL